MKFDGKNLMFGVFGYEKGGSKRNGGSKGETWKEHLLQKPFFPRREGEKIRAEKHSTFSPLILTLTEAGKRRERMTRSGQNRRKRIEFTRCAQQNIHTRTQTDCPSILAILFTPSLSIMCFSQSLSFLPLLNIKGIPLAPALHLSKSR